MTEKPNVKEFAVGSVCVVIDSQDPIYLDKELTIESPLTYFTCDDGAHGWYYKVHVQGMGHTTAQHPCLKLKRLPPEQDAWCRGIMEKIIGNSPLSSKGDFLVVKETQ